MVEKRHAHKNLENLKGREQFAGLGVDWRIILK
jgi:hypothetical protein